MKTKKLFTLTSIILVTILISYGLFMMYKIFSSNTKFQENKLYVYIPTNANYKDVEKIITPYIKNMSYFEFVAKKSKYMQNLKPGRFLFIKNMNSYELVKSLKKNIPVKLSFNNQERLENLMELIGSQIEPDSLKLQTIFTDKTFLEQNGFTKDNIFTLFIPNTYEVYWNISENKFRNKMLKEYHNFWNETRILKAKKQGLTPIEATILASIVHKESVKKDERPRIAGAYLNRLKIKMPLQADPTVIFALKKQSNNFNQIIKRVFYNDLKINSPYNTYKNIGLPPGPIAMPDITAIEAVLNPEKNNYIYFCASVEKFGYHEFAATLEQHAINAKKYSDWVNAQGLKR